MPVVDSGRNIQSISLRAPAGIGELTLGTKTGNALLLTSNGTIGITALVAASETINAPLILEGANVRLYLRKQRNFHIGRVRFRRRDFGRGPGNTILTLNGTNTGNNTISGVISNGSATTLSLVKNGAGAWRLSGANTFTGTTTLSGGTLMLNNGNALQSSTLNYTGGVLSFSSSVSSHAFSLGGLSGSASITLNDSGGNGVALTVGGNNATTAFTGSLNLGAGSFTKTGTGTFTIGGTGDDNGLGMTVNQGTVVLGKTSNSGVHAIGGSTLTINSGGTAQLGGTGGNQFYNWATLTVNSGGTFDTDGLSDYPDHINLAGAGVGGNGALVNSAHGAVGIDIPKQRHLCSYRQCNDRRDAIRRIPRL